MWHFLLAVFLLAGCGGSEPSPSGVDAPDESPPVKSAQAEVVPAEASEPAARTAPDFTLPNLDGEMISLSSYRGSVVVLEWFNPGCPFVKLAHGRELSLKGMSSEWAAKGMKWFGINSAAPGNQGYGVSANQAGVQELGIANAILLDEDGRIGRAYNATRTPQIVVIDPSGNIVYNGAIDNTQGGDSEDAEPGTAANLVAPVLTKLAAGQTVPYEENKPWGCTVKYAR